ncbi:MAG: hypothetical protein A2161_09425 [Candidatus Schekmanbacteria bacterium RBG_13_48_7]|uniref:Glycosyltransferase 2-like domain-containing protein n=1 Tax=Candidatus Schekmanbacteria bacterium RBG_13_48_7 TaxID=1817878 RepID=A0A1F7S143_9BACT|nr:MAG: hypothetical protein A2161_09425 [Candidatus Schekmanbacteria bacterium RBG_13_48_7]
MHSINMNALWFSIPLILAETYSYFGALLFMFGLWRPIVRQSEPVIPNRTVDIYITCYDEPIDIIKQTIEMGKNITYPNEIYVCDDGHRQEIRDLSLQHEVHYLSRPDNLHAKAGNLNYAYNHSQGEFILILDADFVVLPHILDDILGYFRDERVAFVQTPQTFYNIPRNDPFGNDASFFYGPIQQGKDGLNASFSCGAGSIFRRKSLETLAEKRLEKQPNANTRYLEPFETESITEDMYTSLALHSLGWKSAYHSQPCGFALSPNDLGTVYKQRFRWGAGTLQVLFRGKFFSRNLTFGQRISYLSTMYYYLIGIPAIIYLVAPLAFLFLNKTPIVTDATEFALYFIPYYSLNFLMFYVIASGYRWWRGFQNSIALFPIFIASLIHVIIRKRLTFKVTSKETLSGNYLYLVLPQILLGLSLLAGIIVGFIKITYWGYYWQTPAILVNIFWAFYNISLLFNIIKASFWQPTFYENDNAFQILFYSFLQRAAKDPTLVQSLKQRRFVK